MTSRDTIFIGTRGSALALAQTAEVTEILRGAFPGLDVEVVPIRTRGDRNQASPISELGERGVFVREIERALMQEEIDIAVHSLKDLPSSLPRGLCIAGVPERADPRDVLVSRSSTGIDGLEAGARIGTSSLRRAAQVSRYRSDLRVVPVRGKVETRLQKLDEGECDALILAAAGILRLDLGERIDEYLPAEEFVPSGGQGIIAMEVRCGDAEMHHLVEAVSCRESLASAMGEREFLHVLQAGCHTPVGCLSTYTSREEYEIHGFVSDLEGRKWVQRSVRAQRGEEQRAGRECAEQIIEAGGGEILKSIPGAHGE